MIISISRRTDIPAFYSTWFLKRLEAGFADVQNPMNPEQISRIPLNRETADCFLFCTKNPLPMMRVIGGSCALDRLDDFAIPYLFHFTLTPYGRDIESSLPPKQVLKDGFVALSKRLGRERMVWRYDPVVFANGWDIDSHKAAFSDYARQLSGYTQRCIVSFFMVYKKFSSEKIESLGGLIPPSSRAMLVRHFAEICQKYNMRLSICCDAHDYSSLGVEPCGCIDREMIETVLGGPITLPKEKSLRENCFCLPSTDIGAYDSCANGCAYCYAVSSGKSVFERRRYHDIESSLLIGKLPPFVEPVVRAMPSIRVRQLQLGLF